MTDTNKTSGAEYDEATAKVLADALDRTIARSSDRVKAACGFPVTSGADVLAFFDDATVVYKSAVTGSQAEHIEGVTVESVIAACGRIKGRLKNVEQARTAVAALIERNAELEASVRNTEFGKAAEKLADDYLRLNSEHAGLLAERDALAAEVKALREKLADLADAADEEMECGFNVPQTPSRIRLRAEIDAARASAATGGGNG